MKTKWLLGLAFILFVFSSCTKQEKKSQVYNGLQTGQIELVKATRDTTQSYLLYLPYDYKNQGNLPIIWAFDAHADAQKMMDWLLPYAEKYDYIVVVSRNFRNNVPNLDYILSTLFQDVSQKVKFNQQRQYTAGFSGGARIAYYLGAMDTKYQGTAMLSAGITQLQLVKNKGLGVIMFAGWEDFNLTEVRGTGLDLARQYGFPYVAFYFDGGHEYPPHYMSELVYLWFDALAAKKGQVKHTRAIASRIRSYMDSLIAATSDPMKKYDLYSAEIQMLKGMTNTESIEKAQKELEQSGQFEQTVKLVVNFFNLESMLKPQYYKALFTRDTAWWAHEINSYRQKLKQDTSLYRRYFYKRMLSYLSIMCYSVSSQLLQQGQLDKAGKVLTIYQMVDPQNPDVYLFRSCYWLSKGDFERGKEYFNKSQKLGFAEPDRLTQYPCFRQWKDKLLQ